MLNIKNKQKSLQTLMYSLVDATVLDTAFVIVCAVCGVK